MKKKSDEELIAELRLFNHEQASRRLAELLAELARRKDEH